MRSTVCIAFGADEVLVHLPADGPEWSHDDGRRWLDEKFGAYECEPLRASGKVLVRDKLLAVAEAIGKQGFEADEPLRMAFARAAAAVMSSPVVRVDMGARTVSA